MAFQHLDTVIAFGALMLVASLVVTAGTQLVISLLGLRGANLRRSLADLFETASEDRDAKRYARVIARRVLHQPLVSGSVFSRVGIQLDRLPFVPADAAGKLRWAGSGIPLQPWLLGGLSGFFLWPFTLFLINRLIPIDFCAYAGVVTSYIPFLNLCDHPWRSGAILGVVFGGLLSRWRLATSIRLDELVDLLEKLSAPAGGTLPDPAQRAMLVIAGESRSRTRPKANPVSAQMERMFRDTSDEGDGGVAVAVEKAVTQNSGHAEPRVEGLNQWFEHAMDRASQRFTVQARAITVVLSLVFVFAAHLDAIRLFQSLSSDAQMRAQLTGSADALTKQAEQLPRVKESSRTAVPDVYRSAMLAVLEVAPTPTTEQAKPKSRHSSHSISAPSLGESEQISSSSAAPNEIQISTSAPQSSRDAVQATPTIAQQSAKPPAKQRESKSAKQAKANSPAKEREKSAAATGEDKGTVEAKVKASSALATRPGFASREDAALWLRETLDGDPALENLAAAYEQEVNSELPADADKLIDHSASIKRDLARSEFRLIPETWPAWHYTEHELPGLLLAVVLLSLCAPLCYNLLKTLASLRPMPNLK
jgi:hypothetical protein